jgi:hypothetical protein
MKTNRKTPKDVTGDGKFTYADVLKMRGVNVDKKNIGGLLGMAGSLMGGPSPMGVPGMGGGPLMGAFSQFLNPVASAYGQKLANRINPGSTPATELPKAYGGMKVKKAANGMKGKEPDYQGAVPTYNTRNVDPVLDQILGMLTRDMGKMKPKRAARVKKKADLQGQTPEKFLKNRALMRILMGAAAGAAAPQMGNRTSMFR